MKATRFEHREPATVEAAVTRLATFEAPTILAGGPGPVPMRRFRLGRPETVPGTKG